MKFTGDFFIACHVSFFIWNFWLGRLGCGRLIQRTEKESCFEDLI